MQRSTLTLVILEDFAETSETYFVKLFFKKLKNFIDICQENVGWFWSVLNRNIGKLKGNLKNNFEETKKEILETLRKYFG